MIIQFEIESVFTLQSSRVFVLAKILTSELDWKLTENAMLGQVEIENWFDLPRAKDKNGNQRSDLFAFQLKNKNDTEKIKISQIVELKL